MPRKFIKRYLPDSDTLRRHRHLRHFGERLQHHSLWHLNRRSVSGGVAVGLFISMLPVPFQMFIAAGVAILASVNLPISVLLVFITNPVTMGPAYYFAYRIGAALLGRPAHLEGFGGSFGEIASSMMSVWQPLLLGCLVVGLGMAVLGWAAVRLIWRWHVISRRWPRR